MPKTKTTKITTKHISIKELDTAQDAATRADYIRDEMRQMIKEYLCRKMNLHPEGELISYEPPEDNDGNIDVAKTKFVWECSGLADVEVCNAVGVKLREILYPGPYPFGKV